MTRMGRFNQMTVARSTPQGLYLNAGPEQDAILLPTRWVTPYMQIGGRVDVFLYRDSEGRPIATTDLPHVEAGQFACLEVLHVKDGVGAFLDWGLSKDLLLPGSAWAGQRFRAGDRVTVAVYVDGADRVVASCELDRYFPTDPPGYAVNDPVDALVYAESPLGYKAVVNQAYSGLLYRSDMAGGLKVGDELVAYVKQVYADGKIDLQRDPSGYGRVASLSEQILAKLDAHGGRLAVCDKSPPEAIRGAFGCSKKAFKQAVGALYKQRVVRLMDGGIERADAGG